MSFNQAGGGFMLRQGNQQYRFAAPQNFIHQQPPPISQANRGQIMSSSSMNMYQSVGQNQMMQQPPPPVTNVPLDVNVYQQSNNFQQARFGTPQQQPPQHQGVEGSGMMTAGYQQQPRFRQW